MSFALSSAKPLGLTRASRARTVSVRANVPANVAEARNWIGSWRAKQAAIKNRPSWFPGSDLPDHLDGSLPADFGFDPLGLGAEPYKLRWYVQAELVHCRFAMLAVAGILFPELISSVGLGGPAAATKWFDAGKFEYFAPASTLFIVQMLLFAWAEIRRYQDIVNPGSADQDPIFPNNKLVGKGVGYPGFDPMGMAKSADFNTLKVKEIKNGRLAMLAFAGFAAQAYTTGKTPLEGLGAHLSNPWTTTVWQNDLARL